MDLAEMIRLPPLAFYFLLHSPPSLDRSPVLVLYLPVVLILSLSLSSFSPLSPLLSLSFPVPLLTSFPTFL